MEEHVYVPVSEDFKKLKCRLDLKASTSSNDMVTLPTVILLSEDISPEGPLHVLLRVTSVSTAGFTSARQVSNSWDVVNS